MVLAERRQEMAMGGEKKERVSLNVSRVAGRHLRVYIYVCARTLLHYTLFFSEMNGSESDVRGRGDEAREISSEFAAAYV